MNRAHRSFDTSSLEPLYRPLWLTYGLVPLLAGLDKFTGVLTDWSQYVSPWVADLSPVPVAVLLGVVGVVEMAVGLMVLTRWTRLGAWIATAWLCLIAVELVTMGLLDIAVRDLAMAVGAYTLARLAALRETGTVAAPGPAHGATVASR